MGEGLLYFVKASSRLDLASRHTPKVKDLANGHKGTIAAFLDALPKEVAAAVLAGQLPGVSVPSKDKWGENGGAIAHALYKGLKRFKSYGGLIQFDRYLDILDPGLNLYKDKVGAYQLIPGYSKRILPDLLASAIAELWGQGLISKRIRRVFEQHLIAMLNNYDYMACAHPDQLKELFCGNFGQMRTYYVILGAAPVIFNQSEYAALLNSRIKQAMKFQNDLATAIPGAECSLVLTREDFSKEDLDSDVDQGDWKTKGQLKSWTSSPSSEEARKLTEDALKAVYKEIKKDEAARRKKDGSMPEFNVVFFTSTFHIARLAMEVERRHFDPRDLRPSNTVIVGDSSYYSMFNEAREGSPEQRLLALKKVKSGLYDLLMHATDRNNRSA